MNRIIQQIVNNFPHYFILIMVMTMGYSCQSQPVKNKSNQVNQLKDNNMQLNQLTEYEKYVILQKGTDRPFTGKYTDKFDKGTYVCRQCNAPLYTSDSKFHSGCGWPSFDDEIKGAVKKTPDADGQRTEITCNRCGAHLGHVFYGERITDKNTRHCVNSTSIVFVEGTPKPAAEKAVFAGGCFWGVEFYFQNEPGVISTRVGYTGGKEEHPTYQEVSNHATGHYEALEVTFDPSKTSYETLAKLFFEIHDPTQTNGQGNDIGQQYKSVVFYNGDEQKEIAIKLINILKAKGLKIATELKPVSTFWSAEEYHQKYYQKEGGTPYCHKRVKKFD